MEQTESSKEFHRGTELTMKMHLTKEQYESLQEWSNSIPTLYFLDICAVAAIKQTESNIESDTKKAKLITLLRNLDRPQNSFSYLSSLMEKVSDSSRKLSDSELKEQVLCDVTALRQFFKNAQVCEPDEFLVDSVREVRGSPIEINTPNYLKFLEIANNQFKLQDAVSPAYRLQKAKELLKEANALSISQQNPVVLIILACLYGNTHAKRLIKFKKNPSDFNAENCLADIQAIQRCAMLKLQIEHMGRNQQSNHLRSHFITIDGALSEILQCFKPRVFKYIDNETGRETQLTLDVQLIKLLTEIESDEYDQLLELLNQVDNNKR